MALLRKHSRALSPFRAPAVPAGERWERSSPGVPSARSSPLNSNPRALYQHLIPVSICLKMAANAGSMFQYWKRFDLQQLQVSSTSVQTVSPLFASACVVSLGRCVLCLFSAAALVGVSEENSRPLPHIDESGSLSLSLIRNWSSLFNSTSIGHCKPGKPGRRRGDAGRIFLIFFFKEKQKQAREGFFGRLCFIGVLFNFYWSE